MTNVKNFVKNFIDVNEPVVYNGLTIYPIKVKDYNLFFSNYDVLRIEKNTIPDIKVIQMTYLDFLIDYMMKNKNKFDNSNLTVGEIFAYKFVTIMQLCFHVKPEEILLRKNGSNNEIIINEKVITPNIFDDIIEIILYSNVYNFSNEYIDPDVKKDAEEYYKIKNKGIIMPDLSEKISVIMAVSGILKKDILDMYCIDFESLFYYCVDKVDYQINKTAELSGNIKVDKPIEHWVYKRKKNLFEDAFVDYDKVKNKVLTS